MKFVGSDKEFHFVEHVVWPHESHVCQLDYRSRTHLNTKVVFAGFSKNPKQRTIMELSTTSWINLVTYVTCALWRTTSTLLHVIQISFTPYRVKSVNFSGSQHKNALMAKLLAFISRVFDSKLSHNTSYHDWGSLWLSSTLLELLL